MLKSNSSQLELWNSHVPKNQKNKSQASSSAEGEVLGELFEKHPSPIAILKKDFAELHPLTILVVDDNFVNRKIIRTILSKLGYDCSEAINGKEAVAMQKSSSFDYIFMDLDMPIMSGIEATEIIRASKNKQIEIIAVTANVSSETRENCRKAGMNGYLEKPITTSIVKEQLLKSWARIRKRKGTKPKLGL